MTKKIFLICSVRDADEELKKKLADYVANLEAQGHKVHYPTRDTEQSDPTGGYVICSTNFEKILEAEEIHVWYVKTSMGSHFDMGMVFALHKLGMRKNVVFVNEHELTEDLSVAKSFPKFMRRLRRFQN